MIIKDDEPRPKSIHTANGFTVFHKDNAGCPAAFEGGPWFYEPTGWQDDVFSRGYATEQEATEAAENDTWTSTDEPEVKE